MKEIPLTQGKAALVDDADYERLVQWKWHAHRSTDGRWTARRTITLPGGKTTVVHMHQIILPVPNGMLVDHANRNSLDNRRENLRPANRKENAANTKLHNHNTSGYRGVSTHHKKFRAVIKRDGRFVHLGSFDDPISAARAYDAAAIEHFGKFAHLNFPDEVRLPI